MRPSLPAPSVVDWNAIGPARSYNDRVGPIMRILVVEDDPTLSDFVAKGLREAGFTVDVAADGRTGLDVAAASRPDLAVVDVMLPQLDGFALIEALRHRGLRFPVLILSAKRSVDDRVRGLQIGGDDYLTKPFAFSELLARVQALLRRATGGAEQTSIDVGDLHIDLLARRVTRAGQPIDLRPREFALLEYLARHAGQVISKTMIQSRIWDYHFDPRTNVVDVLVCRLREKIDREFELKLLHTRRGMGYVLTAESAEG
jgi:two-component system, OmpR family, response regulator